MKKLLLPLLLFSLKLSAQNTQQIHQKAILIDTHNDVLSNQLITKFDLAKRQTEGNFDLVRAKEGGSRPRYSLSGAAKSMVKEQPLQWQTAK